MRIRNCLRYFVILLTLHSCNNGPTQRELKTILDSTKYDESVIRTLSLYDTLKDVIISNIDTIFQFRNSKNYVFHGGQDTATIREDADEYAFFFVFENRTAKTSSNGEKLYDIGGRNNENMPAFLYPVLERLFKQIGKDKINGFYLRSNGTITIPIKNEHHDGINTDAYHTLYWRSLFAKDTDPNNLMKDTLIGPDWTYMISLGDHPAR